MSKAMRSAAIAAAALAGLLAAVPAGAQQARQHDRQPAPQADSPDRPAVPQGPRADAVRPSLAPALPAPRQAELRALVLQDCGSCHGMRLTGGLGPALTAAALRERPAESLVATVMHGRPGTAMPPWDGLLTRAEAAWIVERLIDGGFTGER